MKQFKLINILKLLLTFVILILICGLVWFNFDLLKIYEYYKLDYDVNLLNTLMSTICQIQAAILGIVLTILAISTSITKDHIFGLTIKEYILLNRNSYAYSILEMMIIQIILIVTSVICLLISEYLLIFLIFIFSCVFELWICITDLPIVIRGDEEALKIISKSMIRDNNSIFEEDKINIALRESLNYYDIFQLYDILTQNINNNDFAINMIIKSLHKLCLDINNDTNIDMINRVYNNITILIDNKTNRSINSSIRFRLTYQTIR